MLNIYATPLMHSDYWDYTTACVYILKQGFNHIKKRGLIRPYMCITILNIDYLLYRFSKDNLPLKEDLLNR